MCPKPLHTQQRINQTISGRAMLKSSVIASPFLSALWPCLSRTAGDPDTPSFCSITEQMRSFVYNNYSSPKLGSTYPPVADYMCS